MGTAAERWREELLAWEVPDDLVAAAACSPWGHDVGRFVARTELSLAHPGGPSYDAAAAALEAAGPASGRPTLLDVGAGTGAASLPLLPLVRSITAVDADAPMLDALRAVADDQGHASDVRTVLGRWPDAAAEVGVHDVAVCHHVLFDVPDVVPFLAALTAAARRRVVVEVPVVHPMTWLNPLWLRFHGIRRPESPTADDLVAVLGELGVGGLDCVRWTEERGVDGLDALARRATRRLCLPPDRVPEVAAALVADPPDRRRRTVTLSWAGTGAAAGDAA